jgi:hypothetical protein
VTTVAAASPWASGRSSRAISSAVGPLARTRPAQQHHVLGQAGNLVQRVADVEHRNVQRAVQPLQVGQHLGLALGVQRGQGSSISSRRGLVASARAMATRWRSPPDSVAGLRPSGRQCPAVYQLLYRHQPLRDRVRRKP